MPRAALVGLCSVLALALTPGCASMMAAQRDHIDKGISVSPGVDIGRYRRVGVQRLTCSGPNCGHAQMANLTRSFADGLARACHEVVEAEEMRRYADFYAERFVMVGGPRISLGPDGISIEVMELEPDLRTVVVDELGLDALARGSVNIGARDEVTGWRTATIDLALIDARGRQSVWRSRHETSVTDGANSGDELSRYMGQIGEGIARKASICNLPRPVGEDYGISVSGDQLKLPGRIYFELGQAQLSSRSHAVLDDLAGFLRSHAEVARVHVEGHTDDVGDDDANQGLSEARAHAVFDYLVARGVEATRLAATGYGEVRPVVANDSPANRAINRRVEFRIER